MPHLRKKSLWFLSLVIIVGFGLFSLVKKLPHFHIPWEKNEINLLFKESITRVTPTHGDVLEVATLETVDTLTRRDSKSLFDDLIYLGTTVSEIKVKVSYRYHILLGDHWDISLNGRILNVVAPQIRPSLPPAIHTDEMEKRSEGGWLRFNEKENLDKLEESLTPTLEALSTSPEKINLVRDSSRKAIAEFVRAWILNQEKWKALPVDAILVSFPDEGAATPHGT